MSYTLRMTLKEWFDLKWGRQAEMARSLRLPAPCVNDWVIGKRPVPPKHCQAIERLTSGQVTRKDLRPNDWQNYWPELANTPAEPAVIALAATEKVA